MQVMLHADSHIEHHGAMADHLSTVVKAALMRFGGRIMRVEAHLSDANGAKRDTGDDIHCTLEAHVKGLQPVVVKDHAGSAHQAIHGAMEKLKRAVGTALDKHAPRRDATLADALAPDTDDAPSA